MRMRCAAFLVLTACAGGGGGAAPAPAGTEIGAGGGTFTIGEVTLVVPAGAVSGPVRVSARTGAALPAALPGGLRQAGPVLELTREGAGSFARPLALTVPYDGGGPASVLYWDPAAGAWLPVAVSDYDPAARRLTFGTAHFSRFAVVAAPGGDGSAALDTGFRAERDGLFHPAFRAAADPGAAPLAMAAWAQWWFRVRGPAGGAPLSTELRGGSPCPTADGICDGEPSRWEDDQVARELALRAFKAACGGVGARCLDSAAWSRLLPPADPDRAGRLVLQTLAAGSPALLLVADRWPLEAGESWRALLVYGWDGGAFLHYDPAQCGLSGGGAEPTCVPAALPWRDGGGGKRVFGDAGTSLVVRPSAFSELGSSADFGALADEAVAGFPAGTSPFAAFEIDAVTDPDGAVTAERPAPWAFLLPGATAPRIAGRIVGEVGSRARSVTWWVDGPTGAETSGKAPVQDGRFTVETSQIVFGPVNHVWLVASAAAPDDPAAPWDGFAAFAKLWIGTGSVFVSPPLVLAGAGDQLTTEGILPDVQSSVVDGTGFPGGCPYEVTLTSSDPRVFVVLAGRRLGAVATGEATVTVACGWMAGATTVRVYPTDPFQAATWFVSEDGLLQWDGGPAVLCEPSSGCGPEVTCCHHVHEVLQWSLAYTLVYAFEPGALVGHWRAVAAGSESYLRSFPLLSEQPSCCQEPMAIDAAASGVYSCALVPAGYGVPFSGGAGTAQLWSSVVFTCGGVPGALQGDENSYLGIEGEAWARDADRRAGGAARVWFGSGFNLGAVPWRQENVDLGWLGLPGTEPPWSSSETASTPPSPQQPGSSGRRFP